MNLEAPLIDPPAIAPTALRDALAAMRQEPSTYPGPIAGCDARFHALLEVRRRLERASAGYECPELMPMPRVSAFA